MLLLRVRLPKAYAGLARASSLNYGFRNGDHERQIANAVSADVRLREAR